MQKVAFIVCYNNELYMRECMNYISWLKIPDGVETEVIGITEADSIAAGYNAAMLSSDAKYKVYLHQDLFLLNKTFIADIIDIFEKHPEYGMLGVLGGTSLVADAGYHFNWNVGITKMNDALHQTFEGSVNPERLQDVKAIDGMLMMTQYDVEWREDIFTGFHFYDISQSFEFHKAGYRVGVVHQDKLWCDHLCGQVSVDNYDTYRRKFCESYQEFGHEYCADAQREIHLMKSKAADEAVPFIVQALEGGELEKMKALLNSVGRFYVGSTQLCDLLVIGEVLWEERKHHIADSIFGNERSYLTILENYELCRFLLKRIENKKPLGELYSKIIEGKAASELLGLKVIAKHAVEDAEGVMQRL